MSHNSSELPKRESGTDIELGELEFGAFEFMKNYHPDWSESEIVYWFNNKLRERLAKCPVVFGSPFEHGGDDLWRVHDTRAEGTHRARLVSIQPIQRDSAESLLREAIDVMHLCSDGGMYPIEAQELEKKIKRLLEKERT